MLDKNSDPSGTLTLDSRKSLALDGVIDVLTFDEGLVQLSSSLGLLTVEGEELHMKKMDVEAGVIVLEGKIDGVYYADERASHKKGLFGRRK
jgi:sporulation protein YabP